MAVDPLQDIIDILTSDWLSANTDGLTPLFLKITDQKRYDHRRNDDVIFIGRGTDTQFTAGIGDTTKRLFISIDLDVRVRGDDITTTEAHWLNILLELDRVLDNRIKSMTNFDVLNPDFERKDLSDKTHKLFRKVVTIRLENYCIQR